MFWQDNTSDFGNLPGIIPQPRNTRSEREDHRDTVCGIEAIFGFLGKDIGQMRGTLHVGRDAEPQRCVEGHIERGEAVGSEGRACQVALAPGSKERFQQPAAHAIALPCRAN